MSEFDPNAPLYFAATPALDIAHVDGQWIACRPGDASRVVAGPFATPDEAKTAARKAVKR